MRKIFTFLAMVLACCVMSTDVMATCGAPNPASSFDLSRHFGQTTAASQCSTSPTNVIMGYGEYTTVPLIAGRTYRASTCGGTSFDSRIFVYAFQTTTGAYPGSSAVLASNDDFCGVQSQVQFVSPGTGRAIFQLDLFGSGIPCTGQWAATGGSSAVMTVREVDVTAPTAVCSNITVALSAAGSASITAGSVDGGSSDNCGVTSLSASPTSFSCGNVGNNSVTLTVGDAEGNTSSCTATVTVQDNTNPTAVCQNASVSLNAAGSASITTADIDNGSSDACGLAGLAVSPASFSCSNVGNNTVTLTVTDVNGNTSSCTATVSVSDNTNPTAVCANTTVALDAGGNASITASDVDGGSSDACGVSLSVSPSSFGCSNVGANTVTLTATDPSGNSATCNATVTVEDNISPTLGACPANIVLNAVPLNCNQIVGWIPPSINDNCPAGLTLTATIPLSPFGFTLLQVGSYTNTYTLTDGSGNSSSCSFTIDILDVENPVLTGCPTGTVTGGTDPGQCGGRVTWSTITGSDNCPGVLVTSTSNSGDFFPVGTTPVSFTATDASGNTASCSFNVQVNDTENPVIDPCPADQTLSNDAGQCCAVTSFTAPTATDNCPGVTVAQTAGVASGGCQPVGTNTITFTATDGAGNTDACSFTITVTDDEAPVAVCQDITVQLDAAGQATVLPGDIDGGSTDNCGIVSSTINTFPSVTVLCANVGQANTGTLEVTDAAGNSSSCTAAITVEDNVAPVALCNDLTVQLDAGGNASITAADVDAGSSDACGIASLSVTPNTFDCSNTGTGTIVVLTVTDVNGNSSACTGIVTTEDNIAPIALCQDITIDLDASGNASITPADVDNGSNDACGIASLSVNPNAFGCANVGSNTVTLTVTDNNGNSSTCTSDVTVEDNVAPNAVCQDITVDLDAAGNASITAADVDGGSTDACGIASLSVTPNTFGCSNVGANTVTLTVTDVNGNSSTCTANVEIEDNVAPNAVCMDITSQLDASGNSSIVASDVDGGSTDACGIASLAIDVTDFTCADVGSNTVTLTVTDVNGNSSTCAATVTVEDNVPPVALCNDITVQLDASGNATITTSDIDGGSNDACGIASLAIDVNSFDCNDINASAPVAPFLIISEYVEGSGNNKYIELYNGTGASVNLADYSLNLFSNGNTLPNTTSVLSGTLNNGDVVVLRNSSATLYTDATIITSAAVNYNGDDALALVHIPSSSIADIFGVIGEDPGSQWGTTATNETQNQTLRRLTTVTTGNLSTASGFPSLQTEWTEHPQNDVSGLGSHSFAAGAAVNPVTLTVTDNNGNVSTCVGNVTVEDNVAPNAVCQDITIQLDANGDASITGADVDGGSTDACGIASLDVDMEDFDCSNVGANSVVLTVTDVNGNSSTCGAQVTVEDNVPPTAVCQNITVQLDATGNASIDSNAVDGGSSDACGIASFSTDITSFTCADIATGGPAPMNVWINEIHYDNTGGDINEMVEVVSTFNAGAYSIYRYNGSSSSGNPYGNDLLSSATITSVGGYTIYTLTYPANGLQNGAPDGIALVDGGGAVVEFLSYEGSFTAASGPANGMTSTDIGVSETSGTAVGTSLQLTGAGSQASDFTWAGSSAATGGAANNGQTLNPLPSTGGVAVVLTVTDVNGNSSTCNAEVVVEDNVPPVITCPADINVGNLVDNCNQIVFWSDATATDNCTPSANITITQTAGPTTNAFGFAILNVGSYTVTYEATDDQGNSATCDMQIEVADTQQPTVTCPADITVTANDPATCTANPTWAVPLANDNCGVVSLVGSALSGSAFGIGTTAVTYTATDAAGNSGTCSFNVTVNPTPLAVSGVVTDVACNGAASGAIDLTVGGGCMPYSYMWSNGATTEDLTGLSAGTYDVTVTDNVGQTATASFTVAEPTALVVTLTPSLFNCGFNISCNGANDGTITISTTGGTPPYTALWNNADTATNSTLVMLGTGTYTVVVEDANGCLTNASVTLTEPAEMTASAVSTQNINGFDISCNGDTDGGIDLTVGGGCAPYTYLWSNGSTTEDLSSLGAGSYSVTATDANGCTVETSIDLIEPTALQIRSSIRSDFNGSPISCPGAADARFGVRVQGGVPGYTFLWNTGDTGDRLMNQPAGTYTVTATDANGCTISDTIVITEPPAFCHRIEIISQSVYNGQDVSCNGATDAWIDLIPCGGTPIPGPHPCPYTTVWSNGATSEDLANVGAGTYTVTITDANGCTSTASVTVTEPAAITATAVVTDDAGCNGGGAIDITPTGGTPPYAYSWSNGAITQDLIGLTEGDYIVDITDANGCMGTDTFTVSDTCTVPSAPTAAPPSANPSAAAASQSHGGSTGGSSSKSEKVEELTVETAIFTRFDLKAYPNPFATEVTIEYTAPEMDSKVTMIVMNSIGQVVYHDDYVSNDVGTANKSINFEGLSSGVYYVTITSGDLRETLKVIKQE